MRHCKNVIKTLIFTLPCLSLGAFASDDNEVITANGGYFNAKSAIVNSNGITPIRVQALREGATTLGAQGALAWRSKHINIALQKEASYLDHIFDFNQLLLDNNALPPVIVESQNNLTLDNDSTIRSAGKTYKIITPARFVTAPPNWRTYLFMNYQKPDVPNKALLPTSKQEAAIWDQYLQQGWKQGLTQANEIFSANISRLKRDFLGMALYRKLLSQKMISAPHVSKANLGITGNKNEMRINDQVTRITAKSALQLNSNQWNPVITK